MGKLTTHVLDTANGKPGTNIIISLYQRTDSGSTLIKSTTTNHDGRTDEPLLEGQSLTAGKYELVFETAQYFRAIGVEVDEIPFLDDVVIRFGLNNTEQHYHVPLLVSPYSFSTYRGS
ncbi:hydroxyisourate hydrolase [Veronia nyctiphanis]|uniref:5-hydroxyisourate hydrolase n=1 Tax=Veronia nyctiphanis TaxID=1278244 RepID=A0A4Q0YN88_9GAMM|nr:hydroxyisourate hydrolase [Veronia nyctiphanis]RXJ72400.1 hydroxyisourate hydrolase [Veronia nyctiphanis]